MGMDAELVAIGPFSEDIVNYLSYPPEYYEDTEKGNTVYTVICSMATSAGSEELAQALGIEPWDFNRHFFTSDMMNAANFAVMMQDSKDGNFDFDESIDAISALKGKGFLFIYLPNG